MVSQGLSAAMSDSVFPIAELDRRAVPANDYSQDKAAIQDLAHRMLDEPEAVLPRFVELAMEIAGGVSAGFSIFEPGDGAGVFRWRHLHGSLAAFENACTPRDFSPCGVTLDRDEPVLAVHAERAYDWISDAEIVVPEVLLVPLRSGGGAPVGTLWIVSDTLGHFHRGHATSLKELATFAGIALRMNADKQALAVALEEQSLLAREMNHRVKNLFAVTDGMIRASARGAQSKDQLAATLSGRLHALASAHALVSRHLSEIGSAPRASDVHSVLDAVLTPHQVAGDIEAQFDVDGPVIRCGDRAINGLAMIFHELATNAAKYGALTTPRGRVELRWETDGEILAMSWRERGGPAAVEPAARGFGGTLIESTVRRQFAGQIDHLWTDQGLDVRLRIPLSRLAD